MHEPHLTAFSRRKWLQSAAIAAAFPAMAFGRTPVSESSDDEELDDDDKKYQTKIETHLIGDHTQFAGLEPVVLEGVGLVRNLSGTGGILLRHITDPC